MEALAKGEELPDPISPEGIDCSDWFHQLQNGEINKGLTMADFWKEAEILATEYTMVSRKRSLGGQLDLLASFGAKDNLSDRPEDQISQLRMANAEDRLRIRRPSRRIPLALDLGDGAKAQRPL